MTVTVSDNYVTGCEECCREVVETPEKQENRGLVAATAPTNPPPLGDQDTLFIDAQSGSLNGFDHAKEA